MLIRFTLTMWDVKMVVGKALDSVTGSFTLTMWDVKEPVMIELTFEIESFTLTMWDVKLDTILLLYLTYQVLP